MQTSLGDEKAYIEKAQNVERHRRARGSVTTVKDDLLNEDDLLVVRRLCSVVRKACLWTRRVCCDAGRCQGRAR